MTYTENVHKQEYVSSRLARTITQNNLIRLKPLIGLQKAIAFKEHFFAEFTRICLNIY